MGGGGKKISTKKKVPAFKDFGFALLPYKTLSSPQKVEKGEKFQEKHVKEMTRGRFIDPLLFEEKKWGVYPNITYGWALALYRCYL